MPIDTREMERTPISSPESSSQTLRVRCPQCRKLYLVAFTDIQEAKPRFECVQCRSRFWLSLSDLDLNSEVDGIPLQVREAPHKPKTLEQRREAPAVARELEPCPKCFRPNPSGTHECSHCGVLIDKMKSGLSFSDSIPAHSGHLDGLWKKVMADYAAEHTHAEFIRSCQREKNLAYAAAQYGQMQKLMPADEMTLRRVREVQALGSMALPPREKRGSSGHYLRVWQVPLVFAVFLMITGMVAPVFRNMIGVGAAFLFLALALQMHLRRRD